MRNARIHTQTRTNNTFRAINSWTLWTRMPNVPSPAFNEKCANAFAHHSNVRLVCALATCIQHAPNSRHTSSFNQLCSLHTSVSENEKATDWEQTLWTRRERREKATGVVLSPVWFSKSHLEIIPLEFGRKSSESIAQQTVRIKKNRCELDKIRKWQILAIFLFRKESFYRCESKINHFVIRRWILAKPLLAKRNELKERGDFL